MIRGIYTGLLFISLSAMAQDGIQAETEGGKPYILHTVSSGETLSSISRSYKLTVAEIATFNKINADKGLQKDQAIRIPLRPGNLSQAECSNCKKVYYKVQPREGLYRIGLNFGNLSAATIQKLNNLPGESVDIGQNLLVGYLPASAGTVAGSKETVQKPAEKEMAKPKEVIAKTDRKGETKPAETIERAEPPLVTEKAPPVKTKEEPKADPVVKETIPQVVPVTQNNSGSAGTGLFASGYEGKMGISKSGTAAVFKSTSGWDDAKYYVLMNNAAPGTIIKVSNTSSGKTVYAKVLGELPQIKQNENVLMRISNAAASALGGGEESLNVAVNY